MAAPVLHKSPQLKPAANGGVSPMENLLKFLPLLLIFFLASCVNTSKFPKVELGNSNHDKQNSELILIPMEDFNAGLLASIAETLEAKHKFQISAFTAMGVSENMFDQEHKQYKTNEIARTTRDILSNNGISFCDKAVIVLTNIDINDSSFRLRYLFSSHYDRACLSIISTARINPINYGEPKDDYLVMDRLMKLINKSIGLNHYKYKTSSNKQSVMYGPIMSPMDLDKVGDWYK
jgi:predicted Zn-dependent protease